MAVYTQVPEDEMHRFFETFDLGGVTNWRGVTQGVENTNYIVETERRRCVLTLFEQRVDVKDLPFFIAYMAHINAAGIRAPAPLRDRDGKVLKSLCGRPALVISYLNGKGVAAPTKDHASAVGALSARMHNAASNFRQSRPNALSIDGWRRLAEKSRARAHECAAGLTALIDEELTMLTARWPVNAPTGVVHADLFPDNVFFEKEALTGVIDFYFACTDFFVYDLAITLNAWCGEGGWSSDRASNMLSAYEAIRPLSELEKSSLPLMLRGSALRLLLTRLHDWLNPVTGADVTPKDPLAYRDLIAFYRRPDFDPFAY